MPRYYFDVQIGDDFVRDEEGMSFDDIESAEREAAEAVACILRDRRRKGIPWIKVTIEVRDESARQVIAASGMMEIERRF